MPMAAGLHLRTNEIGKGTGRKPDRPVACQGETHDTGNLGFDKRCAVKSCIGRKLGRRFLRKNSEQVFPHDHAAQGLQNVYVVSGVQLQSHSRKLDLQTAAQPVMTPRKRERQFRKLRQRNGLAETEMTSGLGSAEYEEPLFLQMVDNQIGKVA